MTRGTEVALPMSLRRPLFGELIRQMTGVSDHEVNSALSEQSVSGGRLGWILCQRGLLDREALRRALRQQARRLIESLPAEECTDQFPQRTFLSVCMPAYNERLNIADTLDAASAILPELVEQFELVVVDDGSGDGTGDVVRSYAEREPRVRLVQHAANRGYGAAVTSALRAARGDLIFFTDSDGQFSLLDLVGFLLEIRRNDLVIGYRHDRAETGIRRFNAYCWNMLIRLLLGVHVRDLDCAYKLFRREVVDSLHLEATGAVISAEIMVQSIRRGWKLAQLPVNHYPRCHGAPTGAALKVIARAFRELPGLWRYRTNPAFQRRKTSSLAERAWLVRSAASNSVAAENGASWSVPDNQRYKICMLAACPFPANHGTPGSIREMAEAIADRGHDVHIVTYHMGEDISVEGPRIHRITPLTGEQSVVVGPTIRRPLYDLQMVFKTIEVVRRYGAHVIHAHGYEAALVAWVARMFTGRPVVCSAHNTMSDELPSYQFIRPRSLAVGLGKLLDALVPRIGDRTIPHSANIARFYRRKGLQATTDRVIYKGIKLDGAHSADGSSVRRHLGLGHAPIISYAGVMNEFQRLDLLLEAMLEVARHEPRAKLLLVVTIPSSRHLAAIRHRAAALGITDRVVLTSPQALDGLPEYLAACDLTVVPRPQSPGFPIKILNYMAAGKPCVLFASSAGGLTHRQNAYLVAPDTARALAEGILEVLRDAGLRAHLARNALEFVRTQRDRRLTAQQVCVAYKRTLNGRACPAANNRSKFAARPPHVSMTDPIHSAQSEPYGPTVIDTAAEILCEAASE